MSSIVDSNHISSVTYDKENGVNSNSNIEKTVNANHTSGSQQHGHTPVPPPTFKQPLKIKNVVTRAEVFDSLYKKANDNVLCTNRVCLGSSMGLGTSEGKLRSIEKLLSEAKDFLDQYFQSIRRSDSPSHKSRWTQVQKEVQNLGTYNLTETELIYGAKQAWRNSPRCIGRIQWSKLQVFDCRYVTTTSGMFDALCNHIKYSTNKGNIRSAITIFPQRTDGKHDFRVWNLQLFAYAGYRQPDGSIVGDPINAEFTEICTKLGWRGSGTRFDNLPLVLSANGHDPDYFDIPVELILEVALTHPTLEWFKDLGLKWYALPAVSSMLFDCGGLQFTACPFNGWYMSTEIGCRDLCDAHRYNMLEPIAQRMGLDTRTHTSLWKDRAMVEANVAVLHSFQQRGVTIMDHHTAAESFMKHAENEMRLRSGCPADWVWIVPPMSSSATPVFHQEMALYFLRPSYEYQEVAWKTHVWNKQRDTDRGNKKLRRKFHFKQIARAVRFASKLFGRALSRRIKATVLYGTETGKSEGYAKLLKDILSHAFNAQVHSMCDYDITNIEHEALLLVVTSTFGNGDPPENGEEFAKNLYALKLNQCSLSNEHSTGKLTMATSKSFIKANSQTDIKSKSLNKYDSMRRSVTDQLLEDTFGPLSNIRFAVFALGSSAYPNFCAFGKYVDNLLGELGGERLLKMVSGDEMCGQEQAFRKWAPEIYKLCCEAFCLDDDETIFDASFSMNQSLNASTIRFTEVIPENMQACLTKCHNKKVSPCELIRRTNLHGENATRATLKLEIRSSLSYSPGDHVGIFARNCQQYVDKIVDQLTDIPDPDLPVELQNLKEDHTLNEVIKTWTPHEKLPRCSVRELFSRFLDITTTPTPNLLQHFASIATNDNQKTQLQLLAADSTAYEDWRHWRSPSLLEVLEEFSSVRPNAALLVAQLGLLQPRFYSISSTRLVHENEIHLTVAVVSYKTQDGNGVIHYGVCSNYLQNIDLSELVYLFVRSAPNFHLPSNIEKPMILVGPGTGIAPFRGFWHHRLALLNDGQKLGKCWLFFGCRQNTLDLYTKEKQEMVEKKVLNRTFLALSREPNISKTYVQDLMIKEECEMYKMLVLENGHFYVCGDVTMANNVYQTIKNIIVRYGNKNINQAEEYMLTLRDENRYHEDIFGITLRTAEIHNKSRETARIRMASEP